MLFHRRLRLLRAVLLQRPENGLMLLKRIVWPAGCSQTAATAPAGILVQGGQYMLEHAASCRVIDHIVKRAIQLGQLAYVVAPCI